MPSRTFARGTLLAVILVSAAVLASGFATSSTAAGSDRAGGGHDARVVAPRENVTVITTDSNAWLGGENQGGPKATSEIVAFRPNGSILYENDSHTRYWDVDPVPGTRTTVMYVAADHLSPSECGGETVCTRNVVERVNLTTGNVTRIFERVTPRKHSTRWHDVDRLNDTHIVVADIAQDRVFVVNTRTDLVTWAWSTQSEYPVRDSGGPYPGDWTHLNDVEVLADGRIMVSLRNHDQVVFLDPQTGLVENWTLGRDDAHDTLYEQHNPDYIPAERGGPAVLVADSENNRVVEYQRVDGTWRRTWTWTDARLQWPRDADRLPNGNTLITDSNGGRVLEVAPNGTVVWSVDIAFPYEAERLGTGDESAGGPSARAADLRSRDPVGDGTDATPGGDGESTTKRSGALTRFWLAIRNRLAGPTLSAVSYVLPVWMGLREVLALVALLASAVTWLALEWRWAALAVDVRSPVEFERK